MQFTYLKTTHFNHLVRTSPLSIIGAFMPRLKKLISIKNFNCFKKIKGTSLLSSLDLFQTLKGFHVMDLFFWFNITYIVVVILLLFLLIYKIILHDKIKKLEYFWVICLVLYSVDIFLFTEAKLLIFKRYDFFSVNYVVVYISLLKFLLVVIHFGYFCSLATTVKYNQFKDNEYAIVFMTVLLIYVFFFKTDNFIHLIL